jgi:hypothetical protein
LISFTCSVDNQIVRIGFLFESIPTYKHACVDETNERREKIKEGLF